VPSPARLDAELAKQRDAAGAPGLVAALVVDARLVWAGAQGRAGPGRRMAPDTPMAFGSITKTVIAAVGCGSPSRVASTSTSRSAAGCPSGASPGT
jgi:CubicO group peptidase (beta-lactamase class C family)